MLNHNKTYLLGLLVGGGIISNGTFLVKLPFKKWGMQPALMNTIALDILTRICEKFKKTYGFSVTYEIGNEIWIIKPVENPNISGLLRDLRMLALPTEGFLLDNADLTKVKKSLKDIVSIESFLSGIFDTRASLSLSHRRFSDEAPVVSIEIPGSTENFTFVIQICSWLTDLGSVTDQILFNHPCQHSSANPMYKGWKKGFKIRFLVKSFLTKHSFALQAKAFDVKKLEKLQEKSAQEPCIKRKMKKPSPVCIHSDINSIELPLEVRNKLFFHYFHFCAVLGCKYAPLKELEKIINAYPDLIFVLPRIQKGDFLEINNAYKKLQTKYFPKTRLETKKMKISDLLDSAKWKLYLELSQGIAYLFSGSLKGKRHIGSKSLIINSNIKKNIVMRRAKSSDLLPIMLYNEKNNRAFLVSSLSSKLNQKLIQQKIKKDNLNLNIIE